MLYEGEQFPLMKNKFLLGTFQGDIFNIEIDKNTGNGISEIHNQINHHPFEPVFGNI